MEALIRRRLAGDHQSAWGCVEPGLLGCAVHSQSLRLQARGDVMGLLGRRLLRAEVVSLVGSWAGRAGVLAAGRELRMKYREHRMKREFHRAVRGMASGQSCSEAPCCLEPSCLGLTWPFLPDMAHPELGAPPDRLWGAPPL